MESLIVFLIFIVFSVLRSLGGDGRRPPARGPVVPPVRPARPVRPLPHGARELHPDYMAGQSGRHGEVQTHTPSGQDLQEIEKTGIGMRSQSPEVRDEAGRDYSPSLSERNVLMGVIFSEILAPPKALRRKKE